MQIKDPTTAHMFLSFLFQPEEFICVCSNTNLEGRPIDIKTIQFKNYIWKPSDQWVSINPYKPYTTRKITNLKEFRNILLEIDAPDMSLDSQIEYMNQFKVPYSLCTYSGNKSYHFIISLTESLPFEEYKRVCKILKENLKLVDSACLEPSTFTRLAGSYRGEKEQCLMDLRTCISPKILYGWLDQFPDPKKSPSPLKNKKSLSHITMNLLKYGIKKGKKPRHQKMLHAIIDLMMTGHSIEETNKLVKSAVLRHNDDKPEEEIERLVCWVYTESDYSKGDV